MMDDTINRDGSGSPPTPADEELYRFVDLRGQTRSPDDEDEDEDEDGGGGRRGAVRRARTPARAATRRTKSRPARSRKRGGSRGTEVSIGLLVVAILATRGVITLATDVLRWPLLHAVFAGGMTAGVFACLIVGPLITAARAALARWLAPSRGSGS